jgi:hypothetical protein
MTSHIHLRPALAGVPHFAVLVLLGLGILAMHGLGSHGMAGEHAIAEMPGVVQASSGHAGHGDGTAVVTVPAQAIQRSERMVSASAVGQLVTGMGALCVAILGVALLLLLLIRCWRLMNARGLLFSRLVLAAPPLSRDRDPPSLTLLSVRLC